MTKMTTKLSDQELINVAKQQYEQKQVKRIPTEVIDLISQGKVYPEGHPLRSGTIEMRYMTAYDEDILTTKSYIDKGIALDMLLESLIVTDVDMNDISVIDKNGLVISARILSYGKEYPVRVKAPNGKHIEQDVDLSQLNIKPLNIDSDENGEFDYTTSSGDCIKFKFPTAGDKTEKTSDFLNSVIMQVNDDRSPNAISEYIRYNFLAQDSRQFQIYIVDNTPGLDLSYEFEYETEEGKKETFRAGFPLGADLFWF